MLDSILELCYYIAIISFEEVLKMKHIIYTTEADLAEYFKDYEEANECTLTVEQKDDLAYTWMVDNFNAEK